MPLVLLQNEIFDIERLALASIERSNAFVDLRSEPAKLLDVGQQLVPDLFLIGFRQAGHFRDSQFKCFDHVAPYQIARRSRYPAPTIPSHSSSLSTATPNSRALPSFEPAPGPATT
jgi:hypothetical protein